MVLFKGFDLFFLFPDKSMGFKYLGWSLIFLVGWLVVGDAANVKSKGFLSVVEFQLLISDYVFLGWWDCFCLPVVLDLDVEILKLFLLLLCCSGFLCDFFLKWFCGVFTPRDPLTDFYVHVVCNVAFVVKHIMTVSNL